MYTKFHPKGLPEMTKDYFHAKELKGKINSVPQQRSETASECNQKQCRILSRQIFTANSLYHKPMNFHQTPPIPSQIIILTMEIRNP